MKEISSTRFVVRLIREDGSYVDILKESGEQAAREALDLLQGLCPTQCFELHKQVRYSEKLC